MRSFGDQQAVAPVDRAAQASAGGPPDRASRRSADRAGWSGAPAAPAVLSTLLRATASSIASGRPSSRTQISATLARVRFGEGKIGLDRAGALDEQRDRPGSAPAWVERRQVAQIRQRQRQHRELILAAETRSAARLVTNNLQLRRGLQQLGQPRRCRPAPARNCRAAAADLALRADILSSARRQRLIADAPESPSSGRSRHVTRSGSLIGAQIDEKHAIGIFFQQTSRRSRSPGAFCRCRLGRSRSAAAHQDAAAVSARSRHILLAADQRRELHRQVRVLLGRSVGWSGCTVGVPLAAGVGAILARLSGDLGVGVSRSRSRFFGSSVVGRRFVVGRAARTAGHPARACRPPGCPSRHCPGRSRSSPPCAPRSRRRRSGSPGPARDRTRRQTRAWPPRAP